MGNTELWQWLVPFLFHKGGGAIEAGVPNSSLAVFQKRVKIKKIIATVVVPGLVAGGLGSCAVYVLIL